MERTTYVAVPQLLAHISSSATGGSASGRPSQVGFLAVDLAASSPASSMCKEMFPIRGPEGTLLRPGAVCVSVIAPFGQES